MSSIRQQYKTTLALCALPYWCFLLLTYIEMLPILSPSGCFADGNSSGHPMAWGEVHPIKSKCKSWRICRSPCHRHRHVEERSHLCSLSKFAAKFSDVYEYEHDLLPTQLDGSPRQLLGMGTVHLCWLVLNLYFNSNSWLLCFFRHHTWFLLVELNYWII